jgi:4a-hydroxytetrahydrobiopterin dehydratase
VSLAPDTDIEAFLDTRPDWSRDSGEISRTYGFADFSEAMGFVTRVALAAEKANHHPDIGISWNQVTLTLSTHSEGGLTNKDLELAAACDALA